MKLKILSQAEICGNSNSRQPSRQTCFLKIEERTMSLYQIIGRDESCVGESRTDGDTGIQVWDVTMELSHTSLPHLCICFVQDMYRNLCVWACRSESWHTWGGIALIPSEKPRGLKNEAKKQQKTRSSSSGVSRLPPKAVSPHIKMLNLSAETNMFTVWYRG